MAKEIKPTDGTQYESRIFLAGTIDNGDSENWQLEFIKRWNEMENNNKITSNTVIFNPRRDTQPTDLEKQIKWEIEHLTLADVIVINFLPNSRSPISLLELGLFAKSGKVIVVCPKEFYRYTNVKVTCQLYGITVYESMDKLFDYFEK